MAEAVAAIEKEEINETAAVSKICFSKMRNIQEGSWLWDAI
jgi:hypothetical protein